jgi:KDO2-lipid IV(A) lauroyltransferase
MTRLLLGMMWLLHWLPLPILGRLGKGMGSLLFVIMKPRREITLTNLRLTQPELSDAERRRLAKAHFQGYARSVLERAILWWASPRRLARLIEVDPEMPVEQMQKRPTILMCPHFVCLEVAGVALTMRVPACSVYSKQSDEVFDEALRRGRLRFTEDPSNLIAREAGIKPIIRIMRGGKPFLMLPDMDFGPRESIFVPFFGVPAATLTAPARLAATTGAQVIPVVARFLPNYRGWKVSFYPPWEDYPGEDIEAATRRMNAFIEDRVREAPAEYFWSHKRFKTRPEGETGFYGGQ